jgi:transglutaminase-like putative cysteine protease
VTGRVRYRLRHVTRYAYAAEVMLSQQLLHLVPRPVPYQRCLDHSIEVVPAGHRVDATDAFGNPIVRLEIGVPHTSLTVTSRMDVDVYARPRLPAHESLPWERVADEFHYRAVPPGRDLLEAARFRHESPHVHIKREFAEFATDCFPAGRPLLAAAEALMHKIHAEFRYEPGTTTIGTSVTEVLRERRGVCQDFAHVMIACLRSRGLPARYVSGYVRGVSLQEDGDPAPVGGGASHAWVSVWAPPFGWVDLDPTNDKPAGLDHVAIAWGRDFADVSPLRGTILGGGHHTLEVEVTVERIPVADAAPRAD